jgi:hypothetical protein
VVGGLFGGAGLFMVWLATSDPGSVNGPWWLGAAAGAVFAAAGLVAGTQGTSLGKWVSPVAVTVIFLGFAAIGNWIAFGPGPRACSGGISFLFFSGSAAAGDMECRVAFGFGAVILDAALVMGLLTGLARLVGSPVWSRRLEKLGTGVLGVALSPLILLAVLLSVFGAVKDKVQAAWKARGSGP